ncbi:MAG: hypothetical protein KDJ65_20555 [Anaerolineae bacterium]|nr:hypothetical protein [Anaerolineae bacterium]
MSCERRANSVGQMAALQAGINRLAGKSAGLAGSIASTTERGLDTIGQTAAPVTARLVGLAGPDQSRRLARGQQLARSGLLVAGALGRTKTGRQWGRQALRTGLRLGGKGTIRVGLGLLKCGPQLAAAMAVIKTADKVTAAMGGVAGEMSRTQQVGQVSRERRRLLIFKSKQEVKIWKSRLTPLLNRSDQLTRQVKSSRGLMFTLGGTTWHQGTSVVQTSSGRRTLTHLQSLKLPATHHYFNRPVSAEQAVKLAEGSLEASNVPGYVGSLSAGESLVPLWAEPKKQLLKAAIHWPPK